MRARDEGTNGWWLSGPGQARLSAMLDSGCFRVRVPEHAALLVVTWLLRNGHGDEARAVLDELAPWMERLRFFPDAAETPVDVSPETQVMTTGELAAQLKESLHIMRSVAVPRVRRIMAMEKACADWRPLKWRLLALFGDTLECQHAPLFVNGGARGTDGTPRRIHELGCSEPRFDVAGNKCFPPSIPPRDWIAGSFHSRLVCLVTCGPMARLFVNGEGAASASPAS